MKSPSSEHFPDSHLDEEIRMKWIFWNGKKEKSSENEVEDNNGKGKQTKYSIKISN